jgi:hypothetical protein
MFYPWYMNLFKSPNSHLVIGFLRQLSCARFTCGQVYLRGSHESSIVVTQSLLSVIVHPHCHIPLVFLVFWIVAQPLHPKLVAECMEVEHTFFTGASCFSIMEPNSGAHASSTISLYMLYTATTMSACTESLLACQYFQLT